MRRLVDWWNNEFIVFRGDGYVVDFRRADRVLYQEGNLEVMLATELLGPSSTDVDRVIYAHITPLPPNELIVLPQSKETEIIDRVTTAAKKIQPRWKVVSE